MQISPLQFGRTLVTLEHHPRILILEGWRSEEVQISLEEAKHHEDVYRAFKDENQQNPQVACRINQWDQPEINIGADETLSDEQELALVEAILRKLRKAKNKISVVTNRQAVARNVQEKYPQAHTLVSDFVVFQASLD